VFPQFVDDLFVYGSVALVAVVPDRTRDVIAAMEQFHLDFDNTCQYVAAAQFGAEIVSFDSDFDRTDEERHVPSGILGKDPNLLSR